MIGFISEKLLIPILDFFYGVVPSYGLAIVALTVVIRIALFPLSAGSIRSARRMKIAQPVFQKRQAEIKSKFSGFSIKTLILSKFSCVLIDKLSSFLGSSPLEKIITLLKNKSFS